MVREIITLHPPLSMVRETITLLKPLNMVREIIILLLFRAIITPHNPLFRETTGFSNPLDKVAIGPQILLDPISPTRDPIKGMEEGEVMVVVCPGELVMALATTLGHSQKINRLCYGPNRGR
jgi:hypothetical protein